MATSHMSPKSVNSVKEEGLRTRQLECVVIGGGNRGKLYSYYALDYPHLLQIKAIADPRKTVRTYFENIHKVPEEMQFADWRDVALLDKFADIALICTQDSMHKDPAIALSEKGYHLLIEKPLATTEKDCKKIFETLFQTCERNNTIFIVGDVLRYFPPIRKIGELIESGAIGDVYHINHFEPVGYHHFSHSYVRGNWRKENDSSFSLMTKSYHDIDLIANWMKHQNAGNKFGINRCVKVSSFGAVSHFTKANKPIGAADRCLDCKMESECPYSAIKIYVKPAKSGEWNSQVSVVTDTPEIESLYDKLQNGPYGECVYNGHNDVCDHQTVNMEFSGGQTASFSMIGYTEKRGKRRTQVFGNKGEITYEGESEVRQYDFLTDQVTIHNCLPVHVGGLIKRNNAAFYLMESFIKAVMFDDTTFLLSEPLDILRSHLLVFSVESSRVKGQVELIRNNL